nr:uncharacterized protein LOC111510227 [Leptinotarsa decemlineata]
MELQSGIHDMESESDVSETGKEQRNQLLESLNTKNKQISDLLMDIEGVEKENFALRQKISKVKDELLAATEEMTSVTKTLESKEKCLKEYTDKLEKMEFQYNDLKKNFNDLHETKNRIENNFQEKLISSRDAISRSTSANSFNNSLLCSLKRTPMRRLETMQNKVLRNCTNSDRYISLNDLLDLTGVETVTDISGGCYINSSSSFCRKAR